MEEIIYDEHIVLDFDSSKSEYRLSIFDKNSHYLDEIYLTKEHLSELYEGLKGLNLETIF